MFFKRIKIKKARLNLKNPIGNCGHHCDFCIYAELCGGCRSDYNNCSFAKVCKGGVCSNVICSNEKKIGGCYNCSELLQCSKDYYGKSNEYIAKATAIFISKYGEVKYTATLKIAIDSGLDYPKSFDKTGSVENALVLLEQFL